MPGFMSFVQHDMKLLALHFLKPTSVPLPANGVLLMPTISLQMAEMQRRMF